MKPALLAFLALALGAHVARADSEIVIAIRYLQAEGVSHSHLYLYREDGKLLRQLTNDNSGQERNPLFSPDGQEIVFMRKTATADEAWSVEPLGKNLHRLLEPPPWYTATKSSPFFTNSDDSPGLEGALKPGEVRRYLAPDQSVEIVLRRAGDESDDGDQPGHGKSYTLQDLRRHQEVTFGQMAGFYGAYDLLHGNENGALHFLLDGALRVTFCDLHLNSTDGTTVFALDLIKHKLVRLSPNWSAPVPLPGEAAFLAINDERYVPIPKSEKTANCSFIEHWDASLTKIRYAKPDSASIAYGFSMYRPKGNPAVICHVEQPSTPVKPL